MKYTFYSFQCFHLYNCPLYSRFKCFSLSSRLSSLTSSVHFLFSVACELWRHSRGSILPGWIWGRIRRRRPRKKPSAGRRRCPHRQGQCSCRPHSNSTPGVSGWPPVSSAPVSCGKGNRPACVPAAASLYRGYLSCVPSILLSVAVLPEKVSCPIPAACSGVGTLLATSGHFVPKSDSLRCFPSRGIPFRTVILFSRCCPSMNYPKSTRKKCNSRNIARIAF